MSDIRKKILIADDEQINLEFFDLMLSKLGFIVEKAENGEQALAKIQDSDPDLVLLDNIMPKMSGWEVTKLLKTSPDYERWSQVPIIMFSAMDDVKDKIEGFDLGVDDYITKPFNFSEVLARIKSVLRNHELIIQLKNRETRLEVQEEVAKRLQAYASSVVAVLDKVCDGSESLETSKKALSDSRKQYDAVLEKVVSLQEKAKKLKNSEIDVSSLQEEIRKSVSQ